MNELISVIVPIYNTEQFLSECIESILNQTYSNLEVVLIDDGSQDHCYEICKSYAAKDERIILFQQQNCGVSVARNKGLELASGSYLSFVDSDDITHPKMLKVLKALIDETKSDIAMCGYHKLLQNEVVRDNSGGSMPFHLLSNYVALEKLLTGMHGNMVVVWNKLFKRELFDGVYFPEGLIHEDTFTTYKVIDKAKQIVYTENRLYYWRKHNSSITGSSINRTNLQSLDALKQMRDYLYEKNYYDLHIKAHLRYLEQISRFYCRFAETKSHEFELRELREKFRFEYNSMKHCIHHMAFRRKLPLMVFRIKPQIYYYMKLTKRKLLEAVK